MGFISGIFHDPVIVSGFFVLGFSVKMKFNIYADMICTVHSANPSTVG